MTVKLSPLNILPNIIRDTHYADLGLPLVTDSSVDGDGLSSHVVGQVCNKELHDLCAVFDGSFPSQRNPLYKLAAGGDSAGVVHPWGDAVYIDVVRAELLS